MSMVATESSNYTHYESDSFYKRISKKHPIKLKEINWKPDLIISSYHGIPKSYFDKATHTIVIVIRLQD